MSFIVKDMRVLAYANGFTLWSYATGDTLEKVQEEGYFDKLSAFAQAGDLVIVISGGLWKTSTAILVVSEIGDGTAGVRTLAG